MDVTLQYFDGCPNWQVADEHLRALADEYRYRISYRRITSIDEAQELNFIGSPTILVNGRDPFARGDELTGFACRVYDTPAGPAGSPTIEQLRRALI
ncbi:MAG: thioredoxin family protein [Jiangellaceae bacterium]